MKRQRGRGRKPGGGGGGGGSNHHHGNRSLESNGPDVKIRGTAAQIYEKYSQFARDAQSGGDRVKYENYLQHAEHYYRVMAATMPRERLLQQQNGEGGFIHAQTSSEGGGGMQSGEGSGAPPPGEQHEPVKTMDDGAHDEGDDDSDDDEGDGGNASTGSGGGAGEEAEAGARDEGGEGEQGDRQGRSRRGRRRRRPQDGPPGERQGERPAGGDPEARSALDSLARKQGALTGG